MNNKKSSRQTRKCLSSLFCLPAATARTHVKRQNQSGNIFFALFGAVALVGIIGATTMAVMRGPLSTMVEVQSRAKAESEMAIASRLTLLEAVELTNGGDCDGDGFVEPLEWTDAAGNGPTGGGFLPMEVASARTDPWGVNYGYCAWDAGNIAGAIACDNGGGGADGNYNRLDGNASPTDNTYTVVAVISAGANQQFETTCTGGASPGIAKGGDDIVVEYTYEMAVSATDGLWKLKSGDPTVAEIDKRIEVTGGIDLSIGGTGTGRLSLGAGSMMYPDQTVLSVCPGALNVNVGLLRMNTSTTPYRLEICDSSGWVPAGGSGLWEAGAGNDIFYNTGTPRVGIGTNNPGSTLQVVGTFDASGAVTFGSTLDVTGASTLAALNATGAVDFDSTLNVDGATTLAGTTVSTLNATGAVDLGSTLDVTGAVTLDSTLDVLGNTFLDGTLGVNYDALFQQDIATQGNLDVQGHIHNSISALQLDDAVVITGTLDARDAISNSAGDLILGDDVSVSGDLDVSGTVNAGDYRYNGVDFTPSGDCDDTTEKIVWNASSGWGCAADENDGTGGGGGGALWTNNTTHITRSKIHILNSGQTPTTAGIADGLTETIIWHPDLGAFRGGRYNTAGYLTDANIGIRSFAFGNQNIASAEDSVAFGWQSRATADAAFSAGTYSYATNNGAVALASSGTASGAKSVVIGTTVDASGARSFAFGLGVAAGTRPIVSGAQSFGIFMGDQSGYNLSTSNRMALVGGHFMIDDNGTTGSQGCIRYNNGTSRLEFSNDCSTYTALSNGQPGGADTQVQYNKGGALAGDSGFTYDDVNDTLTIGRAIVINGQAGNAPSYMNLNDLGDVAAPTPADNECLIFDDATDTWVNGSCSAGGGLWTDNTTHITRQTLNILNTGETMTSAGFDGAGYDGFIFHTDKNAFTGGSSTNNQKNEANIGSGSFSFGSDTRASGSASVALGRGSVSSNMYAFSAGDGLEASGWNSIAFGRDSRATGSYSTVFGLGQASGANPIVSGQSSFGIFMGDQSTYNLNVANRMGLVGGHFMIDDAGATGSQGCIRYDGANSKLQYSHDCTTYADMGAASGMAINDLSDAYTDYATDYNLFMGSGSGGAILAGGQYNTFIGINAGTAVTTADNNTALGYEALRNHANATNTVAIGYRAMQSSSGSSIGVTAIGSEALSGGSGDGSTAVGRSALANATGTSHTNTAVGSQAMRYQTGSNSSVAVGYAAGQGTNGVSMSALRNVLIGREAGYVITTGDDNTLLGYQAGNNLTSGSSNIIIGSGIAAPAVDTDNHLNIGGLLTGTLNAGLLTVNGTGALTVPSGDNAARDALTAVDGMIRYNSEESEFEVRENGAWVAMRGSGSSLWTDNTTHITREGFHVINAASDSTAAGLDGDGSRVFLATNKMALRGGSRAVGDNDTAWQNAEIGTNSFAWGDNTSASGANSVAFGAKSASWGDNSFSTGTYSNARGWASFAAGHLLIADGASSFVGGEDIWTFGDNAVALGKDILINGTADNSIGIGHDLQIDGAMSMAIGLGTATGDVPKVTSANSLGIFMGDQGNYDLTTANRMALIGGHFMIDDAGATGSQGCIRYDGANSKLQYSHDCTTYADMGAASGVTSLADADNDTRIQVEEGADDDTIRFDTAGTERMIINPSGNIGIGTGSATLTRSFEIAREGAGNETTLGLSSYSNNAATDNFIVARRARGTLSSPAAVQNGDQIFEIYADAYDGNSWEGLGYMTFELDGAVANEDVPSRIKFATRSAAATNAEERLTIDSDGDLHLLTGLFRVEGGAGNQAGCIRYDDTNDVLQYSHDCTTYADMGTGGGGLWTDNTTHITREGFHVINAASNTTGAGLDGDGSRAFYAAGKSALRGGAIGASGTHWQNANIGQNSFAYGYNVRASGSNSVAIGGELYSTGDSSAAFGWLGSATGSRSFSAGYGSHASEWSSIALGGSATASGRAAFAVGEEVTASGTNSMAFGLGAGAGANPIVSGANSLGVFMGDQSGYNLSVTNRFGIVGGHFMIDDAGASGSQGCIRYDGANSKLQYSHDCSTYADMGAASGMAINDLTDAITDYVTDHNMFMGTGSGAAILAGGQHNIGIGTNAAGGVTTGDRNVAIGYTALAAVSTNSGNTAIGYRTMTATTGEANVAMGTDAMRLAVGASYNTVMGLQAMENNVGAAHNAAFGEYALQRFTRASGDAYNSAFGAHALRGNGTVNGRYNTAVGGRAGENYSSGENNVFIGYMAGQSVTSGSSNIIIGANITTPAVDTSNHLNIGGTIYGDTSADTLVFGTDALNLTTAQMSGSLAKTIMMDDTWFLTNSDAVSTKSDLEISRSRGTAAAPTIVQVGDQLGSVRFRGYDGSDYDIGAAMLSVVDSINGANVISRLDLYAGSVSANDNVMSIWNNSSNNGRVGIGTTTPNADLQVHEPSAASTVNLQLTNTGTGSAGGDGFTIGIDASQNVSLSNQENAALAFRTNGTERVIIDAAGQVGIGEPAPDVALDVAGDIEYTGTITDVSDMRLKDNIAPLNKTGSLLERLDQIKTYSFTMKDDEKKRTEYGVMAQELEAIFPDLVHTAQDEMGTKSVNYVGLIAPMIEATKELKAENDALKAQHAQTMASLDELSRNVATLNKIAGNNVGKASMADYWLFLLGMIGGIGLMVVIQRKKHIG